MTAVADALLLAYLRANYRVPGEAGFVLKIGVPSAPLAALYRRRACACAAFLTAWNPLGEPRDEALNRSAQHALLRELESRGHAWLPAIGEDPARRWPGEESLLVPGMALDEATAVAARWQQNALVWAGADARPQLILLR